MKVYILEDDPDIGEVESYALQSAGFETRLFGAAAPFYQAINQELPALVLLDVMLPDESGLQVLRRLRADRRTAGLKIILVTAKTSELDTVKGLDMGADDYIAKPFGVMELVSRVKARVREHSKAGLPLTFEGIVMDEESRTVTVDGAECELTYKEYELLHLFLSNPGIALKRELILDRVWGYEISTSTRTLDMHIRTLRQKLGEKGECIQTVRHVGYRLAREEKA